MKLNKEISKLIDLCIKASFEKDKLKKEKILESLKILKTLPPQKALQALSGFKKRVRFELNKRTLLLESAVKLSEEEKKKITSYFNSKFSIQASVFNINPALLGGVRIKIGDALFDDSVKARVEMIKGVFHG